MTDENITRVSIQALESAEDQTRPDAPEGENLGTDFWSKAKLTQVKAKRSVHLRVDPDVFDYFKSQGKGHLTRMNAVLRAYVNMKRSESDPKANRE